MVNKYSRLLKQRELNVKTGKVWAISDIPSIWKNKVETKIYADGYYFDDDGTVVKANPVE